MKQEIIKIKIDEIKENPKNTKNHTSLQVAEIRKSIADHWYLQNIVISDDNTCWIGHWRLMAIKELKKMWSRWDEIEVLKLSWYTAKQLKKLAILDNKTNEMTGFNLENLKIELDDLGDFELSELFVGLQEPDIDFDNIQSNENRDKKENSKEVMCPMCEHKFKI